MNDDENMKPTWACAWSIYPRLSASDPANQFVPSYPRELTQGVSAGP